MNVGQTGSYGLVMVVLDSEKRGGKFVENIANISTVLYEPTISSKMEALRL